jgi:TPR repeat protein
MTENNKFSISELQQKANDGDAQAQFELALCYANGADMEKNIELAFNWHKKAAEQGHVNAQFALGLYYLLGKDQIRQTQELVNLINKWLRGQASGENIDPALDLAVGQAIAINLSGADDNLAFAWLKKAAEQNHAEANYWLGQCYRDGIGTKRNDEMAFNRFRLAAEHGLVEAQFDLACCYFEGKGVLQNAVLGRQWCEKAAKNGFAEAQYILACCYLDGVGMTQNFEQSIVWLNKASQNDDSVIEDKMMMRLAEAHAKGIYAKQSDTPDNNLSRGEACYQAAIAYFDGRGFATDYEKGMTYLRDAIKCDHAGAKQWLENAYLQFTFPEFIGRDDAEQCYQDAYNWLSKAFKKNPLDQEVNFALGVLFAFGKGTTQNHARAFEYFYKFHTGDGIDDPNPDYPDELDDLANIYCAIHENWNNGCLYPDENSGKYFTSQFQSSKQKEGNYIVLPSLVMDFYYANREFDLLRSYLGFIEESKGIFEQQSTQKHLKKMIFVATELEETLEEKNKALEASKKELEETMSMFAHKFRSPLDTIIYNTTHENQPKLYIEAAQTMRGLLDVFSIISTEEAVLKTRLEQDIQGNSNLMAVFDKTLDMILLHLLSASGAEKIQQHYLRYAKEHELCDPHINYKLWNEEHYELERQLQTEWEQRYAQLLSQSSSLEQRLDWLEEHFFKLELHGFDRTDIQFKEYGVTESFLTILLNEILINAFKYYSSVDQQPVVLEWIERDGYQWLSCCNPSIRAERTMLKGSGKGHTFLSALARKTGSQFNKPKPHDDFVLEFGIANELLKTN